MKLSRGLILAFAFALLACQPTTLHTVTVLDNNKTITLQTDEQVLSVLLHQARVVLNPKDRVLLNGLPVVPEQTINDYPVTIQICRAVTLTLLTAEGEQKLQSAA